MDTHTPIVEPAVWRGWNPGEYQAHFIHTGVAEAIFHIFPDGTTLLLDCGDHAAITRIDTVPIVPGPNRIAGDWIARYVSRVVPQDCPRRNGLPVIDAMMLSHFHKDHCGSIAWQSASQECRRVGNCYRSGFGKAIEQLAFNKAIDRGWPDYDDPPRPNFPDAELLEHVRRIYSALEKRDGLVVEKFRLGATDQLVPVHAPDAVRDFSITNIAANGHILCKDGSIKNIYGDYLQSAPALNENGMSLGFILRYGKFSLYTGGDFSDTYRGPDGTTIAIEDVLAEEAPHVCVAKINHHGYHSMPRKLVSALSARAWIACVWTPHHVLESVLERLTDRSLYEGPRTIFPTVFSQERLSEAAGKPYLADIAPETFGTGAHVVVTVPPGGETYTVTCIDAADESMRVLGEYRFESH